MADDLAKAIVRAADMMESGSRPMTIATIRVGKFPCSDGNFDYPYLVNTADTTNLGFNKIESAINRVFTEGYIRMNETEEQRWKEMLSEMKSKVPQNTRPILADGEVVLVFWKPLDGRELGNCDP